jgi:hypothetical protein
MSALGAGVFRVTCPFNNTVYSCGVGNYQLTSADNYRYAAPVSSTTCQCRDANPAICMAYCGSVTPAGYEIRNSTVKGNGTVACSAGKKVMSCSIAPSGAGIDLFRKAYPAADGQSCQCSDNFGATCVAICANARPDYEVSFLICKTQRFFLEFHFILHFPFEGFSRKRKPINFP